jgi:hypothetical protein
MCSATISLSWLVHLLPTPEPLPRAADAYSKLSLFLAVRTVGAFGPSFARSRLGALELTVVNGDSASVMSARRPSWSG